MIDSYIDFTKEFPDLERLLAFMPCHVYVLDHENRYLMCNKIQAKSAGFSDPKEVIGKTNKDLFKGFPKVFKQLDKNNLKVLETMLPYEFEEITPDNKLFRSYKVPLVSDNGKLFGLLGTSYEVTDIRGKLDQLNTEIDTREITIENLMSSLPGNIYLLDRENNVLDCNDQQAEKVGFKSRRELIGRNIKDFYSPGAWRALVENNKRVTLFGEEIEEEEVLYHKLTKKNITYLSKKVPLRDKKGGIVGLLGISVDITDRKERERLEMENQKYRAELDANWRFRNFLEEMMPILREFQKNLLDDQMGDEPKPIPKLTLHLTKRERQVLHLLSINKNPKEIAYILGKVEGKSLASTTIQSVVDKQLYPKFDVNSVGDLLTKAGVSGYIPLSLMAAENPIIPKQRHKKRPVKQPAD